MENGKPPGSKKWRIQGNQELMKPSGMEIKNVIRGINSNLNPNDKRPVIPIGHGDPTTSPCFHTAKVATEAICEAIHSGKFNGYSAGNGMFTARKAVAEYLTSHDQSNKLSANDVYLTLGCSQAIEISVTSLATPNANILLPRPGYPNYEARARLCKLEVRHFDLLPDKGWEVDLDSVEALGDENTVAMVIINPGNPTGSVYTHQHLQKVAETANKLGIMVISDEVYAHLTFGSNPFIPMGVFGSIAPVLTLGSISKRWIVPGWRFGWIAVNDPNRILAKSGFLGCMAGYVNFCLCPPTFIQAAIPHLLEKTPPQFFSQTVDLLRQDAEICFTKIKDISCITCPYKPQGSIFIMVKLDVSQLADIGDDIEFCNKLAQEESVIVLPGTTLGMNNWLRITFSTDPSILEDGFDRIKSFCQRHVKQSISSTQLV